MIEKIQNKKIYPLAKLWRESFPDLYKKNDARILWFEGVGKMTNNLKLGYLSIFHWQNPVSWTQVPTNLLDIIKEFETFILWGYIHGLSMITEETFRLIWKGLGNCETDKLWRIHSEILKKTNNINYQALFKLFRNLRNMCHHNGFFVPDRGGNNNVIWRAHSYHFVLEKGVDFVSVKFLMETLTADLCEAINLIMSSAIISGLPFIERRVKSTK